jgi:hypothetical protein
MRELLGFFMLSMLLAVLAMLFKLQALLQDLLVLPGKIVDRLALGAFQLDHVVLRHRFKKILKSKITSILWMS